MRRSPYLLAAAIVFCTAPFTAQPQSPDASANAAPTARSSAPIDLTGYWVSVVTQDWRWRMVTPAKGDYRNIPMTVQAGEVADAWDPEADEAAGEQCKSYGAPALMSVPGRLHITWQDDDVLRVETDAGMQTRLLHFAEPPDAADTPRSWQGISVAQWQSYSGGAAFIRGPLLAPQERRADDELSGGTPGGSLKVVTSNLRPGYLRKNGVPYGEDALLTEYWDVLTRSDTEQWLTITTHVEDPLYLREPRLIAIPFRKEADGEKWDPTPCSATW